MNVEWRRWLVTCGPELGGDIGAAPVGGRARNE